MRNVVTVASSCRSEVGMCREIEMLRRHARLAREPQNGTTRGMSNALLWYAPRVLREAAGGNAYRQMVC